MEPLSDAQRDELRLRLMARMHELAARVREELAASDQQHYRDLAGSVADIADAALAGTLVELDTASIDRHISELRDIDAAHERMKSYEYGICADCGDGIAYQRLSVYPTAKRCLYCQQQYERSHSRHAASMN